MEKPVTDPQSLTILIADDSDTDRLILTALVRRLGHRVFEAADGQEAVQLFQSCEPDIVLLDALMPVMDGMEAARRIKEAAGERMVLETAGGGGRGDPSSRDPGAIETDRLNGLVSGESTD